MTNLSVFCRLTLLALLLSTSIQAQEARHPLDALTWREYWAVLEVLQANGHLDGDTQFQIVTLKEPDKDLVLTWSPGQAMPRAAFAIVRQGDKAYEALVDIAARRLVSWQEVVNAQTSWLEEEYGSMDDVVMANPEFVAAMQRRGIEDFSLLDCETLPPGYFGTEEQQGRRIANFQCHLGSAAHNTWSRSIENLTVVVDMNTREVLRVVDEGVVPVPPEPAGFDEGALGGPSTPQPGKLQVNQPWGPGFTLDGGELAWQNWSFHLRSDQRVGVVVSLVSWHDGDEVRPVMYQGFLSEIFVPYMDPAFAWFAKNYLDLGEYSTGGLTKPLMRNVDCPDYAAYLPALVSGDDGRPLSRPDMICVFEREAGEMSWRHAAPDYDRGPEGRQRRDLVVRSAAVLGNYDYIFDWVFQQDGAITVAVGATGIVAVKAVAQRDAASSGAATAGPAADAYGRFVDAYMVAVNHDHYFNFRLDMDVDGQENSFVIDRLETQLLPADHPRRSIWVSKPQRALREDDAQLSMGHDNPELWMVTSSGRKNGVGYATSYQLMPGHNASSLLTADDYPQRRAGFTAHQLWVTPFAAAERFAAGDYPTLSTPGQGLPAWTADNRNIEQTDIVLWYTIGMHHLVRAEDWPVMPVMWSSFQLRPFNFFDHNPAMQLAPKAATSPAE